MHMTTYMYLHRRKHARASRLSRLRYTVHGVLERLRDARALDVVVVLLQPLHERSEGAVVERGQEVAVWRHVPHDGPWDAHHAPLKLVAAVDGGVVEKDAAALALGRLDVPQQHARAHGAAPVAEALGRHVQKVLLVEHPRRHRPVEEAILHCVQAECRHAAVLRGQVLVVNRTWRPAQRVAEAPLQAVVVLGGLVQDAELAYGVEGENLAQPSIGAVDVAPVGDRAHLLPREAQPSDGTAEGTVRDLHARLEDEGRAVVLERGARGRDDLLDELPVLEACESKPRGRVGALALVRGHVAIDLVAGEHVRDVVPRHAEAMLLVRDAGDRLAKPVESHHDPPSQVFSVRFHHGDTSSRGVARLDTTS